jgi:hypothetical protein
VPASPDPAGCRPTEEDERHLPGILVPPPHTFLRAKLSPCNGVESSPVFFCLADISLVIKMLVPEMEVTLHRDNIGESLETLSAVVSQS